MTNWQIVYQAGDKWEAELVAGLLESAGIPVRLIREALGELYGLHTGPLAQVQIAVPQEQAQEARKLIQSQWQENSD